MGKKSISSKYSEIVMISHGFGAPTSAQVRGLVLEIENAVRFGPSWRTFTIQLNGFYYAIPRYVRSYMPAQTQLDYSELAQAYSESFNSSDNSRMYDLLVSKLSKRVRTIS